MTPTPQPCPKCASPVTTKDTSGHERLGQHLFTCLGEIIYLKHGRTILDRSEAEQFGRLSCAILAAERPAPSADAASVEELAKVLYDEWCSGKSGGRMIWNALAAVAIAHCGQREADAQLAAKNWENAYDRVGRERDEIAGERDEQRRRAEKAEATLLQAFVSIDGELTRDCVPEGGSEVVEACRQFTEATRLLPETALDPEFGTLPESVRKLVDAYQTHMECDDMSATIAAQAEEIARLKSGADETGCHCDEADLGAAKVRRETCPVHGKPAPEGLPAVGDRCAGSLAGACKGVDAWWNCEHDKPRFVSLRNGLAEILNCIEALGGRRVAQPEAQQRKDGAVGGR